MHKPGGFPYPVKHILRGDPIPPRCVGAPYCRRKWETPCYIRNAQTNELVRTSGATVAALEYVHAQNAEVKVTRGNWRN